MVKWLTYNTLTTSQLSLREAGLRINLSMIQIPSRPNSTVDCDMNLIPNRHFDVILIKIDQF